VTHWQEEMGTRERLNPGEGTPQTDPTNPYGQGWQTEWRRRVEQRTERQAAARPRAGQAKHPAGVFSSLAPEAGERGRG